MIMNDWAKEIHENAVAHGWWDEERSFGDIVALCHSELSEALEEYRTSRPDTDNLQKLLKAVMASRSGLRVLHRAVAADQSQAGDQ